MECGACVAWTVLAADAQKRVKWLLFKGVSECLKWSHQRTCRELGCEARGGGVVSGLCHAYLRGRVAAADCARQGGNIGHASQRARRVPDTKTAHGEFIR